MLATHAAEAWRSGGANGGESKSINLNTCKAQLASGSRATHRVFWDRCFKHSISRASGRESSGKRGATLLQLRRAMMEHWRGLMSELAAGGRSPALPASPVCCARSPLPPPGRHRAVISLPP